MAADIPLKKIENPSFRAFLEKYCNQHIPHDTTVRKTYVDVIYEETMSKIRDETTDVDPSCRCVGNVVIEILFSKPTKLIFLTCQELEEVTSSSIARLFVNSLKLLSDCFDSENVLPLLVRPT